MDDVEELHYFLASNQPNINPFIPSFIPSSINMPTRVLENVPVGDATSEAAAAAPKKNVMRAATPPLPPSQGTATQGTVAKLELTMGGVTFSLEPRMNPEGQVTFQAMGPTGATLKLNNFTGELCVKLTSAATATSTRSVCTSTNPNQPERPLRRQDSSVTPSPSEINNSRARTSPASQQRLVQHARVERTTESPTTTAPPASQAPTPTITNGTQPKHNKSQTRHHSEEVEQVVAANRSSPLPYHSPVKRSRSSSSSRMASCNDNTSKKSKTTQMLSQQLPPSPISLGQKSQSPSSFSQQQQRSPNMLLSQQELDCSQTQPSSSSTQPSCEEMEPTQSPIQEPELLNEDDEAKETVEEILQRSKSQSEKEDNDEEDSVATLKPDDYEEEEEEKQKEGDEDAVMKEAQDQEKKSDEEVPMEKEKGDESKEANTANEKAQESSGETTAENDEESLNTTSSSSMHNPPAPRWGHTATMIDHNRILVCGGQTLQETDENGVIPTTMSDVHVFELDKQKWFQPIQSDDASRQWPRQWHSATYLPERGLLICFGGETMHPKTGRVTTSDKNNLMVLDTEILLWYPPQVSGDLPTGRSGHCATLLPSSSNNELVIFGGVKSGKHLNTVSVLDTNKWMWSTPKIQGIAPKARSYASATAIQATPCGSNNAGAGDHQSDHVSNSKHAMINIRQRIVIFGGNDAKQSFGTVHVLEKIEGAHNTWRWFHPTVSGTPPKPRTGHSATLMADQKTICVYGGWDPSEEGEDVIYDDSYLLDTESWSWQRGPVPVFAGHSLDSSQGSNGGARRVGHSAVLNTTNKDSGNEVLVFGGRVPGDEFTGDFQTLHVS